MPRPKETPPTPPLILSPSSLPQTEGLPDVEVSMVEAADVTGVSFSPELWMQRRHWALQVLRKEGVRSVLDVGAGPGALLETLIQPASTVPEAPLRSLNSSSKGRKKEVKSASGSEGKDASTSEWEGEETELFLNRLAALDPNPNVLPAALSILDPGSSSTSSSPANPISSAARRRYTPLTTELWLGGIESYNQHLEGYEAMVALEVIEHLDPLVLSRFGVVCLGTYRPRLLLISTPNFDFNAKFPRHEHGHDDFAHKGFIDPTGRTERVFRHSDHKLEMTSHEFREWATSAALDWGYEVDISGVGISSSPSYYPADHPHSPKAPIYASQVALFRLASGIPTRSPRSARSSELPWLSKEAAHPHKLVGRFVVPATAPASQASGSGAGKSAAVTANKADVADVREKVRGLMQTWRISSVSLGELWGDDDLAAMCGGSRRYLVGCLGGWGDQPALDGQGGQGGPTVEGEDPGQGGRGLVVRWDGLSPGGTESTGKKQEEGWAKTDARQPPSEATGGW